MGDTRTSTVINILEGGDSTILRTGGEEFSYRLAGGISTEPNARSVAQDNEPQVPGVVPDEHADMKTMASVSVSRDVSTAPAYSGYPVHPSPNEEELYSSIDKSKKKSKIGTIENNSQLEEKLGNDNMAFGMNEYQYEMEPSTRNILEQQIPSDPDPKQWQFAKVSESYKETTTPAIPVVNGITKKHNFEKGFGPNGVVPGSNFPNHGTSSFSEVSSKIETEEEMRERKKQKNRDKNPLFYCKLVCTYPKTAFG